MSAQADFFEGKKRFCIKGRRWLGHKSLQEAWKSCTRPGWLGWWLCQYRNVDDRELRKFVFGESWREVNFFTNDAEDKFACDRIRAAYTHTGKKRKPRG